MKSLFHIDNPVFQFFTKIVNLIIVNCLFLICSLPIITIGASMAAIHKVTQDILYDTESGICKTFFRAFKENFKQATVVWLIMLVFFAGMGGNFLLIGGFFSGWTAVVLKCFIGILVVMMLCITAYLFPLMARYQNTLRECFRNATILAITKLPRTIGMVLINTLPFWIFYFSAMLFMQTLIFWLVIGCASVSWLCSVLLAPVFAELEQPCTDAP